MKGSGKGRNFSGDHCFTFAESDTEDSPISREITFSVIRVVVFPLLSHPHASVALEPLFGRGGKKGMTGLPNLALCVDPIASKTHEGCCQSPLMIMAWEL